MIIEKSFTKLVMKFKRFQTFSTGSLLFVVFAISVNTIQFNVVLRELNNWAFPVDCI